MKFTTILVIALSYVLLNYEHFFCDNCSTAIILYTRSERVVRKFECKTYIFEGQKTVEMQRTVEVFETITQQSIFYFQQERRKNFASSVPQETAILAKCPT